MENGECIEASAPTRIDLAGGTVDIWPLYLFHEGACTINAAINLNVRLRIVRSSDDFFHVINLTTGRHCCEASLDRIKRRAGFELFGWALEHFRPDHALEIHYTSMAPQGAGLAGSSALLVALCGALNMMAGNPYTKDDFPWLLRDIETRILGVPAGLQDYYPALWGGIHFLRFGAGTVQRRLIRVDHRELEQWLMLVFTGTSRNSGSNNWSIVKHYIDGNRRIKRLLGQIVHVTDQMGDALIRGDYGRAAEAMRQEARHREHLLEDILTPDIRHLGAIARACGVLATKVCGAGGGGCVLLFVDPRRRQLLNENVVRAGYQVLPLHITRSGLTVRRLRRCGRKFDR